MRHFRPLLLGALSLLPWVRPAPCHAQDVEKALANLKRELQLTGPLDEGKVGSVGPTATGQVVDWRTSPGKALLEPEKGKKHRGKITIPFTGRERTVRYGLGAKTSDVEAKTAGTVTATYSFTLEGEVCIFNVKKEAGKGRVGAAVVRHLEGLNGKSLLAP